MHTLRPVVAALLWLLPSTLPAQKPAKDSAAVKPAAPKGEQWVTRHSIIIAGRPLSYVATAGTLVVKGAGDTAVASIGYVAYIKQDVKDPSLRPITFAYNGGPGSSSIWLHMGALGPRRVIAADAAQTPPPPYRAVDNTYSLLDHTDLVMIDPVGTGLSHALGEKKDKDFWAVDPDIESLSWFIKQFVTDNGRWNSPKYLLGESYGTTRSAGIVDYLQAREDMAFNGVVLVSVALDLGAIFDGPGNERTFPLFVPSFAATSFYHRVLPSQPVDRDALLSEVRTWALGPYTAALMKGDALGPAERQAVAVKLHEYTGLSLEYLERANLRVTEGEYTQELLREHRETVGRLDSRYTGVSFDPLAKEAQYDPQSASISAAYVAAFLDYYHRELNVPTDRAYTVSARAYETWDWKHRVPGAGIQPMVNTGPDLAHAIGFNPDLRVLVLNGVYDLATPFLATEYMMDHLGLSPELKTHIIMKYYDAGHMMYLNEPMLARMKADIGGFIDATARTGGG
jgi:carboxypeptidase C (cathepsin A)